MTDTDILSIAANCGLLPSRVYEFTQRWPQLSVKDVQSVADSACSMGQSLEYTARLYYPREAP